MIDNFSLPYQDYDIIKGFRADDSYFSYAESFLNNTISCQRLAEAMKLGNLGEQIVIKSQKAFSNLKFIGYELAKTSIYFPMRQDRNIQARNKFLSDKAGPFNPDSLYLCEIIKEGVKADDPRIQ